MKLSEIKQILAAGDIRLTKSLGQNFLHDANQLRRIVAAAELKASDKVLEIGPGLGPLTELLLAGAGEVLAIEKDRRLVDFLRQKFALASGNNPERRAPLRSDLVQGKEAVHAQLGFGAPAGRLTLVAADALDYLRRAPGEWSDWKLVANLPYSVASPILVELAQGKGRPERMVVTLQWEVAHRLVAQRGDEDCGLLTLLIQLRYQPQGWFRIPVGCLMKV